MLNGWLKRRTFRLSLTIILLQFLLCTDRRLVVVSAGCSCNNSALAVRCLLIAWGVTGRERPLLADDYWLEWPAALPSVHSGVCLFLSRSCLSLSSWYVGKLPSQALVLNDMNSNNDNDDNDKRKQRDDAMVGAKQSSTKLLLLLLLLLL